MFEYTGVSYSMLASGKNLSKINHEDVASAMCYLWCLTLPTDYRMTLVFGGDFILAIW